jgi:hypothetical protein
MLNLPAQQVNIQGVRNSLNTLNVFCSFAGGVYDTQPTFAGLMKMAFSAASGMTLSNKGLAIPNMHHYPARIAQSIFNDLAQDLPNLQNLPPAIIDEAPTIPMNCWTQQFLIEAKDMQASMITMYRGNFDSQLAEVLKWQLNSLGFLQNQVRDRLGMQTF